MLKRLPQKFRSALKNGALFSAKLIFTGGIFALLFRHTSFGEVWERMKLLTAGDMAALFGFLALQLLLSIYRWMAVLDCLNYPVRRVAALRGMLLERLVNSALPSFVGGDAGRLMEIRRSGVPFMVGLKSIVLDRALAIAGLVILMVIMLARTLAIVSQPELRLGIAAAIIASALLLVVLVALPKAFWHRIAGIGGFAPLNRVASFALLVRALLRSPRFDLAGFGSSVAIQLVVVGMVAALAKSLGVALSLADAAALIPIVTLVSMAPLSVAGWGFREGAMVVLLGMAGIAKADALALSMIQGLATGLFGVLAGLAWLFFPRRRA